MIWQPIETAPKDGTRILGFNRCDDGIAIYRWDVQPYHKKPRPYWQMECCINQRWFSEGRQPTHWMPLPEPPK
jgi:hypothetical protein